MVRDELSYVVSIPPSAFDRNTDLAEYGLDSIDAATVISMLEDDLDIRVLPQDFAKLRTVNDIVGYLVDELVPQDS